MVRETLLSRGRPSAAMIRRFVEAGYTEQHVLEIVLAIAVKTLSNYVNHLFDTPLDKAFMIREYSAYKVGQKVVDAFRSR
jgi:hypothetical protein